jgi:proline dehydrogenase
LAHNLFYFADLTIKSLYPHKTNRELRSSRFLFTLLAQPLLVKIALQFWKLFAFLRIPIGPLIRLSGYNQFCAGVDVASSGNSINKMVAHGVSSVLDYAHEHATTEADYNHNMDMVLETIRTASKAKRQLFAVVKPSAIGPFGLFEQKAAGKPMTAQDHVAWEKIGNRMKNLAKAAQENQVVLMVDAEESWIQHAVDELIHPLMRQYNRNQVVIAITLQFYLKGRDAEYANLLKDAATNQYHLGVKLVRGAYLEKERERASQLGIKSPTCDTKGETDSQFRAALKLALSNIDRHVCVVATHNEADIEWSLKHCAINKIALEHPNLWFSQLYGMRDFISFSIAAKGANVFKYVPFGPVNQAIPYLIRRALENSSMKEQTKRERKMIQEELKRRKTTA